MIATNPFLVKGFIYKMQDMLDRDDPPQMDIALGGEMASLRKLRTYQLSLTLISIRHCQSSMLSTSFARENTVQGSVNQNQHFYVGLTVRERSAVLLLD